MITKETAKQTWQAQVWERLLAFLSRKFILSIVGLGVSTWMTYAGRLEGEWYAIIVLGLAGAHAAANAAVETVHVWSQTKVAPATSAPPRVPRATLPRLAPEIDFGEYDDEDELGSADLELLEGPL